MAVVMAIIVVIALIVVTTVAAVAAAALRLLRIAHRGRTIPVSVESDYESNHEFKSCVKIKSEKRNV